LNDQALKDQALKTQVLNDRAITDAAAVDLRALTRSLARYREPNHGRSIVEILITVAPFVLLWSLMWASLHVSYWLCLLLAVPAGGFLVRLFMIQHDCGHGSFFRNRLVNDWVGRVIGVFTLTPYDFWRHSHGIHHATSGNLDQRGIGDIDTLTVREYLALSRWRRLRYRLYRHPLVMFGIGPTYLFILRHRLPVGLMRGGWAPWISTMATNGGIALVVGGLMWWIGVGPFLLVHLPITVFGGAIGVWLFYVQHQFEHTVWSEQPLTGVPADRHLTQSRPVENESIRAHRDELLLTHPALILDGLGPVNPHLAIGAYEDLRAWREEYEVVGSTGMTTIYRRK